MALALRHRVLQLDRKNAVFPGIPSDAEIPEWGWGMEATVHAVYSTCRDSPRKEEGGASCFFLRKPEG